jgi:HlyD family secretion protein
VKRRKKVVIIGVVVVVVLTVGTIAVRGLTGKKKEDGDEKVEVVRRGEFLEKVRELGNLESLVSVEVRSNVEGEIEDLFVKAGEFVEKGQKLIQIDDQQIREQQEQAKANRDARRAQLEQAKLRINMTEKQQESLITQAENTQKSAKASLESLEATTRQRITEAETQISTSKNTLEQDLIASRQADIALQQARLASQQYQAAEESAKVASETADAEYKRNKDLFEKKLVSKKSLEDAETRRASALYQYETAKKNVESQGKTVESQDENIEARKQIIATRRATLELHRQNLTTIKESQEAQRAQLTAELENAKIRRQQILDTTDEERQLTVHSEVSAKASLMEAESRLTAQNERLGWTTIIAPISGTITRLDIEEGEIVTSGRSAFSRSPALMVIDDLDRMVVKTRINEVEVAKIKVDQRVEIEVDAYPDKVFEGRVSEIARSAIRPQGQGQGGGGDGIITFEVIIEVTGSPRELLPGMSADIDIIVFQGDNVLQLPIEAVLMKEVMTVKANVPKEMVQRLRSDQEVEVQNLIGKKFKGKVGAIRSDRPRGNVEVLLDGTPRGLRTGPTEVNILIRDKDPIKGIEAEIESEKKYFVLLDTNRGKKPSDTKKKNKKQKEKGVRTRIEVGRRNNSHFELISGVVKGDRVFLPSMHELTRQESDDK